jgi:hypothetical protein
MDPFERADIKKALEHLPSDVCAALALRGAMRVLPILSPPCGVSEPPFSFWRGLDRARFLL